MHTRIFPVALFIAFVGQCCLPPPLARCAPSSKGVTISAAPALRADAVSGNSVPQVFAPSAAAYAEGDYVTLSAQVVDPDGADVLTVSVVGAPQGLEVTTSAEPGFATATVSGVLPVGSGSYAPFIISWSARDGVNPPSTTSTLATVGSSAAPEVVANKILVDFVGGAITSTSGRNEGTVSDFEMAPSWLRSRLEDLGATRMRRLLPWLEPGSTRALSVDGDSMSLPVDLSNVYLIEVPGRDPISTAGELKGLSEAVRTAEPCYVRRPTSTVPNDSMFAQQWALLNLGQAEGWGWDIRATRAWDVTTGMANPVRVGIIDSGIDLDHPDLVPVDSGANFVSSGPPDDDCPGSHGTAVTGIAAARGNNGSGVAGINWGATPVPLKVGVYLTCPPEMPPL